MRFIDWIWHVRGHVALPPQQTGEDALQRLIPLFAQAGTRHERSHDRLTFSKQDQSAQDKMSVFDGGTLQIERGQTGFVLRYNLISRALLFCFLAPLLFLAIAQLTVAVVHFGKPAPEKAAAKKPPPKALPQNPIDKFLGSPAPAKPGKDEGKRDRNPTPTAAYVFAGIFAFLYLVGRILEDRLVKNLFRRRLLAPDPA